MEWQAELAGLGTVAIAGALGGLVGLEREFADKPAGLRTHCFVAAGAALLVLLGNEMVTAFVASNPDYVINADPVRVIQAVVVGISFLGAGTIVREKGDQIEGLTTAASIFLTAGVGIAVGVGYTVLAAGTAVMALTALIVLRQVNQWIGKYRERRH